MNLKSDKRLNIQLRLDFSSMPTGEARQAGWGEEQPTRPQSSGVQVPVPPIACRRAVSISDARGGNEPRSART